MILRILTVILLLALFHQAAPAQQVPFYYPFTQLTTREGLAQMQVRDLQVDEYGFLWIATQGGLSRYDGKDFRNYGMKDGLPDEQIVFIRTDEGKIWGATHTELFSFDGRKCQSFSFLHEGKPQNIMPVFPDPSGNVWVSVYDEYFILQDSQFQAPQTVYPKLPSYPIQQALGGPGTSKIYLIDQANNFYVFSPKDGMLHIDSTTLKGLGLIGVNGFSPVRGPEEAILFSAEAGHFSSLFRIRGDTLLKVAAFDPVMQNFLPSHAEAPIGGMFREEPPRIWVRDPKEYKPAPQFAFSLYRNCFPFQDRLFLASDHGLTIGLKNGLETMHWQVCENTWSVVPKPDGNLLIGCYQNGVFEISPDGYILNHYDFPPSLSENFHAQLLTNFASGEAQLFGSIRGFFRLQPGDTALQHFYLPTAVEALDFQPATQCYYAADESFVYRLPEHADSLQRIYPIPAGILGTVNPNDLLVTPGEDIWIAGNGGIGKKGAKDPSWIHYSPEYGNFPCEGAVCLAATPDGRIWAGTTCGLLEFQPGAGRFEPALSGLKERINNVVPLPDSRLAVISQEGLFLIKVEPDTLFITHSFDKKNGFELMEPSENGASCSGGFLWIPATNGLQRLNLTGLPTSPFEISIRPDRIDSIYFAFSFGEDSIVEVQGKSHLLSFSLINHGPDLFRFQISVNGGPFSPAQESPEFLLSNLRHGLNKVVVRATGGLDLEKSAAFSFRIKARLPFFERRSTLILLGVLLLTGFLLSLFYYLATQKEKERRRELQRQLYLNRLKTIQAYLNPHFLFNTLTSIQNAILNRDREEGNAMILSLSKLLRQVLDTGNDIQDAPYPFNLVSLKQELNTIREYLFLESVQQQPPIRYAIEVDDEIDQERLLIPPLVLQPFIENSILHAFPEKQQEKMIKLSIRRESGQIQLTLEDNGIGMAGSVQKKEGRSMGIQLIRQRLEIMRGLGYDSQLSIQPNEPSGTKITLTLPSVYENHHRRG